MNSASRSQVLGRTRENRQDVEESLMERVFAWLDASLVRQAAGELARECHAAVWAKTNDKAQGMRPAEARGYIRAFVPEILAREVDLVLQRRRVRDSLRTQILEEATEQVVEMVAKDVVRVKGRRGVVRAA